MSRGAVLFLQSLTLLARQENAIIPAACGLQPSRGAPFDFGNVEHYRSHLAPRDGLLCMPEITDFFNVAANPSRGEVVIFSPWPTQPEGAIDNCIERCCISEDVGSP